MTIVRNHHRAALVATAVAAIGLAATVTAGPAQAANGIKVSGVGPVNVGVDYSCDAAAGVAGIEAMVGDPNADRPSAQGSQRKVTCDGAHHNAVIMLASPSGGQAPMTAGQRVQVRVALVDRAETVVAGQAAVMSLG